MRKRVTRRTGIIRKVMCRQCRLLCRSDGVFVFNTSPGIRARSPTRKSREDIGGTMRVRCWADTRMRPLPDRSCRPFPHNRILRTKISVFIVIEKQVRHEVGKNWRSDCKRRTIKAIFYRTTLAESYTFLIHQIKPALACWNNFYNRRCN